MKLQEEEISCCIVSTVRPCIVSALLLCLLSALVLCPLSALVLCPLSALVLCPLSALVLCPLSALLRRLRELIARQHVLNLLQLFTFPAYENSPNAELMKAPS